MLHFLSQILFFTALGAIAIRKYPTLELVWWPVQKKVGSSVKLQLSPWTFYSGEGSACASEGVFYVRYPFHIRTLRLSPEYHRLQFAHMQQVTIFKFIVVHEAMINSLESTTRHISNVTVILTKSISPNISKQCGKRWRASLENWT